MKTLLFLINIPNFFFILFLMIVSIILKLTWALIDYVVKKDISSLYQLFEGENGLKNVDY